MSHFGKGKIIMFKYCFNSTTLRGMDIWSALRHIKASGYAGVELTLNDSHLHPLTSPPRLIEEVRDFCDDNAIAIVCLAAGGDRLLTDVRYEPSLTCADAAGRRRRLDLLLRTMDIARFLHIPVVNFNSGLPADGVTPEDARGRLQAAVGELVAHADGIVLVIEPEPDFFVGTTHSAIDLIQAFDDPRLRLNLDIGHVFCSEERPYESIEAALPFTRHIHIEDIKNRIHHHEIPGEGDIDFRRVFGLLRQAKYEHYVSVELHHHDGCWQRALDESLSYLSAVEKAVQ